MEKVVLKSMVDFVLEQAKNDLTGTHSFLNCYNYANFLKQPLTLGMFEVENQLFQCELFHEAILCEGHNVESIVKNLKRVEDLLFMSPTLTETAIKQIGL